MMNRDLKVIVSKCEELMRPGVLPEVEKANNDYTNEKSSKRKRHIKR